MEDEIKKYLIAGDIDKQVYEIADKILKPGALVLDIVDELERFIQEATLPYKEEYGDAGLAFPVNFSINHLAAHDTAKDEDERVVEEGDVIKLDTGVQIDGYICDASQTYYFDDQYKDLVNASRKALKEGIKVADVGVKIYEISEAIHNTIENEGFMPIANLTGHKIDRYVIHAGFSIPNVRNNINIELKEGDVIAIEPFAVQDGLGSVKNDVRIEIYEINNPKGMARGSRYAQILWNEIKSKYSNLLPFSARWLTSLKGFMKSKALQDLMNQRLINGYPVLKEKKGAMVSQWERTLLLTDKGVKVIP